MVIAKGPDSGRSAALLEIFNCVDTGAADGDQQQTMASRFIGWRTPFPLMVAFVDGLRRLLNGIVLHEFKGQGGNRMSFSSLDSVSTRSNV
jgi:hypothetical protein